MVGIVRPDVVVVTRWTCHVVAKALAVSARRAGSRRGQAVGGHAVEVLRQHAIDATISLTEHAEAAVELERLVEQRTEELAQRVGCSSG